ncbi:MAG: hypothetical protein J7503_11230 [Cellulomonas iranensis]|uniref:hypothetical protein n=1 Tax=Cellulomonas iranensis TaxID=76862 RepID=UPI001B017303|nr:hypothetical protein [Cellulomonas iranensis]MBO9569385.1 hypothetical protein [Cellulomonas iranensis]
MRTRPAAWTVVGRLVGGVVLLGGCAGAAPPGGEPPGGEMGRGGAAEVVDAADCAVQEVVVALGAGDGEGLPAAPRAGAVPRGFEPVAAVECRLAALALVPGPAPELVPELGAPAVPGDAVGARVPPGRTVEAPALPGAVEDAPAAPDPSATEGSELTSPGVRIDAVRLEGDLGPLLAQLRRPDVAPRPDQACMAMFQAVPVLYLVDADGRAVRARWPTDACGFLREGAIESVAALTEVDRDELTLP